MDGALKRNIVKEEGSINLDYLRLRKAALILRSLNHLLRQQIIEIILENKKISVTDIHMKLGIEQSIVSQHLALLRKAGILKTEKDKKYIFYTVNEKRLTQVSSAVAHLINVPSDLD